MKSEQLGDPNPVSAAHDASTRSDQIEQGHSDAVQSGFGGVLRAVGEPAGGLAGGSLSQSTSSQAGAGGATTTIQAGAGDPWRVASQVAEDDPEAADELWDAVPSQPRPRAKKPKAERREEGAGDAPESSSARARARPAHRQTEIQEMEEGMEVAMEEQPVYDGGDERGADHAWGADGSSFEDGLDVEEEPLVLGDLDNRQVVVPGSVNRRLFPYQVRAAAWLASQPVGKIEGGLRRRSSVSRSRRTRTYAPVVFVTTM